MITVNNLNIDNYIIDLEFNENKLYGLFSLDKNLISSLFLMLSGINNTKGKILYNNENAYDNEKFFRSRIYLDCEKEYFQSIKPVNIKNAIFYKFNKVIDLEKLSNYFKVLDVRGECEITSIYQLTPCGNTFVNLSVLLASNNDLLINNPTVNVTNVSDIAYLVNEISHDKNMRIIGLNSLLHFKDKLDILYLFTPFNEVIKVNPSLDVFYLIDKHNAFLSLYNTKNPNKMIVKGLSNDEIKYCERNKISYQKINIYELEKYI